MKRFEVFNRFTGLATVLLLILINVNIAYAGVRTDLKEYGLEAAYEDELWHLKSPEGFVALNIKYDNILKEIGQVELNAINVAGFCERVQSNDMYVNFAKTLGSLNAEGFEYVKLFRPTEHIRAFKADGLAVTSHDSFVLGTLFDSPDDLLHKWMSKKRDPLLRLDRDDQGSVIGARFSLAKSPNVQKQVEGAVKSCVIQLINTDFIYLFAKPDLVKELRQAKIDGMKEPRVINTVREVSDSGEVSEKKIYDVLPEKQKELLQSQLSKKLDILFMYKGSRELQSDRYSFEYESENSFKDNSDSAKFVYPHWLALLYGGEKVLSISGAEFMREMEPIITQKAAEVKNQHNEEQARIKSEQAAKLQAEKDKQQKEAQQKARIAQLKSKAIPIANFEDAVIFYGDEKGNISPLLNIAAQPLLKPDNSIVSMSPQIISDGRRAQLTALVVDFQEPDGTLRCKVSNSVNSYVWLRINKGSRVHGSKPIAVRGNISVIGKYVENRNYTTLSGNKTAPVIEVLHYTVE